mgnify:CR=1 FL=1
MFDFTESSTPLRMLKRLFLELRDGGRERRIQCNEVTAEGREFFWPLAKELECAPLEEAE